MADAIRNIPFERTQRKGNMFPLTRKRGTVFAMNTRLTETQIRRVCVEMLARNPNVSGRKLRKKLLERFGAVGRTERVFAVWRDEARKTRLAADAQLLPPDIRELQERLKLSETAAAENLARAELAEYRERAHQDHWAVEIDRLKQQLQSQLGEEGRRASRVFSV